MRREGFECARNFDKDLQNQTDSPSFLCQRKKKKKKFAVCPLNRARWGQDVGSQIELNYRACYNIIQY